MFPFWNPSFLRLRVHPHEKDILSLLLLPLNPRPWASFEGEVAPGPAWPGPLGPQRPRIYLMESGQRNLELNLS